MFAIYALPAVPVLVCVALCVLLRHSHLAAVLKNKLNHTGPRRELEVTSTGIDMETIGSLGGSTLCQQEVLSLLNNNHVTLIPEVPSEEVEEGLDELVPPGSPPPPYMEICSGQEEMCSGQEELCSGQVMIQEEEEEMHSGEECSEPTC